jgi:ectoine hydroxylase-related dioxygenase (phytanoyl-CoA dioxygenase family)
MTAHFKEQGYWVFPGIFSAEEIEALRAAARRISGDNPACEPRFFQNILDTDKTARRIILSVRVRDALRRIVGNDFVLVNEHGLHDSFFGGWHTDTTSPEHRGYAFHLSDTFSVIQCAVYLQPNSDFGGGVTLVPGSHVLSDPFCSKPCFPLRVLYWLKGKAQKLVKALPVRLWRHKCSQLLSATDRFSADRGERIAGRNSFMVPSQAGDLVCFHLRTWHRATHFLTPPSDDANRKFALFFVCGANNQGTRDYRSWLDAYRTELNAPCFTPTDDFVKHLNALDITVL